MEIRQRDRVFSTPWFEIIAKTMADNPDPFYSLQLPDYAVVVAVTDTQEVLLVRQYRPAVERYTLELPSGHVEGGEDPKYTARRELYEETGYEAHSLDFLGCLDPDTGRYSNRLWCYFAPDVTISPRPYQPEPGIELVRYSCSRWRDRLLKGEFNHALHLAPLFLAVCMGKITL
ncbi:MAG: NUDIX hydrolase [Spirulinaceae cyanobacterium]